MIGDSTLKDINSALSTIYCSTINNIDVNLSNKEIVFDLTLVDNGNITKHQLSFVNCTSFLWIEKKYDDNLYDYKNCNYYELTSIDLQKVSATSEDEWLKQYPMEYNVAVEIWRTALLIKADELVIDQQSFSI
jgi:hypothetical protein